MNPSPRPAEKRVVIVEDHQLFAEAMDVALSVAGYDVRRVPVTHDPSAPGALVLAIVKLRPAVVLLDLDLGQFGDGSRVIEPITQSGAQVVVVTGSADRSRWGECLRYGARKAMPKTMALNDVLSVVRRINQGLPVMDRTEREELLRLWHEQRQQREAMVARLMLLTKREQEVLVHLMKGRQVREIAALSVVSEATVRTQVKSILAKLEVSSQLAAVGMAHEIGWRAPVV